MKRKAISRRKFLIDSMAGAAGIGFLAGCDKRISEGPDIRPPSAPKGLEYALESDGAATSVIVSWSPHDCTDVTGSKNRNRYNRLQCVP